MKPIVFSYLIFVLLLSANTITAQTNSCGKADLTCCCIDTTMSCRGNSIKIATSDIVLDFKTKNMALPKDMIGLKRGDAIRVRVVNYRIRYE